MVVMKSQSPARGLYHYLRVPFGLKNAPPHFMRCIDTMLRRHAVTGSQGFVDDLLTGGKGVDSYLARVEQLLKALRADRWLISPSKAKFGYSKLKVLGHIVEANVIKPDDSKVAAIHRLLPPENVK